MSLLGFPALQNVRSADEQHLLGETPPRQRMEGYIGVFCRQRCNEGLPYMKSSHLQGPSFPKNVQLVAFAGVNCLAS